MSKYYFVAFELSIEGKRQPASNVIIKDRHPVEWAAVEPSPDVVTYLLFWQEIPESVALSEPVGKTFTVEA